MSLIAVDVPSVAPVPLVVAVPHAGTLLTAASARALKIPTERLRALEDPWVDALVADVTKVGGWRLRTAWSRAVADVNRAPDEYAELRGEPAFRSTAKARAGLGVVPTTIAGRPIYRAPPNRAEVDVRLALAHTPYHARLRALVAEVHARFGSVLLLDCHSMPQIAQSGSRVDIAIGDRFGTSASPDRVAMIEAVFQGLGLETARNRPYAGGFVTEHYGRPDAGVHTVQIELRRGLYMDEKRFARLPRFGEVATMMGAAMRQIAGSVAPDAAATLAAAGE